MASGSSRRIRVSAPPTIAATVYTKGPILSAIEPAQTTARDHELGQ